MMLDTELYYVIISSSLPADTLKNDINAIMKI